MTTWRDRIWQEFRADNLTRGYRDVLLTLATFRGHGGLCVPSHETLAERARCSISTVQRALMQARDLGLISWIERRVRASWRWLRTSNRYWMETPPGLPAPGFRVARRAPVCTTGQMDRGGEGLGKKAAWEEMRRATAGLPDLLAMRRKAMKAHYGTLLHGYQPAFSIG
jgi:DNA-binding transcriptional MocR family regulator